MNFYGAFHACCIMSKIVSPNITHTVYKEINRTISTSENKPQPG
jgi:hypothetical protein